MYNINESTKEVVSKIEEDTSIPQINSSHRQNVTDKLIENQMKFMKESADQANVTGASIQNWQPVLLKMVRRSTPNLIAFDLAGVQPMSAPTGSIFAMRSRYTNQTGTEALHDEANTAFSGAGTHAGDTSGFETDAFGAGDPVVGTGTGTGMSTSAAEKLGTTSGGSFGEMSFSIERSDVAAKSRALKAEYSTELAHDLRQIHNMDAESELGNILSTEIAAEQDREMLRTINISAELGCQSGTAKAGVFDVTNDTDGRWMVEDWKCMIFRMELEANAVARSTRRGKANRVVCSANVASALAMTGILEHNPKYAQALNVDETGNTYAGLLLGRYAVYIDPYATVDYITVAYRGANAWDAGVYYCPYVPLQMMKATGEDSFQPKIAFKTRYGTVANPFASATASGAKAGKGLGQGENPYFRKFKVVNLT